jgi:hypothetical protein
MTFMRGLAFWSILALSFGTSILLPQQSLNGAIEGLVVDALTGQPVSGAQVNLPSFTNAALGNALLPVPPSVGAMSPAVLPTTTGSEGRSLSNN